MRKSGILNPQLNRLLSETGHTDILTICDRGFPVPIGLERIDLALVDNIPTVMDVLKAIRDEFVIDSIIVTEEMMKASPERFEWLKSAYSEIHFSIVTHERFKAICPASRAVIRTGDNVPYANLMIISG